MTKPWETKDTLNGVIEKQVKKTEARIVSNKDYLTIQLDLHMKLLCYTTILYLLVKSAEVVMALV